MAAVVESLTVFAVATAIAGVGIISPNKALRTLCAASTVAIVAFKLFPDTFELGLPAPIVDTWAKTIILLALHIPSVLLIRNYRPPLPANASWATKAKIAYKQVYNCRWIGTPYAAPGLSRGPKEIDGSDDDGKQPARMSRAAFIGRHILMVAAIALFEVAKVSLIAYTINIGPRDVAANKTTYFRRLSSVTWRETAIRTCFAIDAAWTSFALFTALHSLLACLFVGVGLDEPHEWPPVFGSIVEAYSIRRFWSKFYDRIVYRTLATYAELVLRPLSGARHGQALTGWRRVVLNFLIFFSSGLLHASVARRMGFTCGFWEEMQWWCLNFFALMFETVVQAAVGRKSHTAPSAWQKALGYAWVFGFLFWSVPKYQYVIMRCAPDGIDMFPGHPKATDPSAQLLELLLRDIKVDK